MTIQGHPRSLILTPIESAYATSYWSYLAASEILELLYAESHLFVSHPYSGQNFRLFPWSRYMILGSTESGHPKLTKGEIIFEEFQPMWSWYLNITDRRTDDLPWQYRISTALCV